MRARAIAWLPLLVLLVLIAGGAGGPAAADDPTPVVPTTSFFSCPPTYQQVAPWSMQDHDCGTDVIPGTAVYISAKADDGSRESRYALCCYDGASLLRLAPPDFAVAGEQWKRILAPAEVTNRHITRSVCGLKYTGVPFEDCRFTDLDPGAATLTTQMQHGKNVYYEHCSSCHKTDGMGMPPILPALKNDDVVTGPPDDLIETVAFGIPGTIMLAFSGAEPDDKLSDEQLAAVLTYIRNSWGNDDKLFNGAQAGGVVTAADVKRVVGKGAKPGGG
jgi:mono/diheme cytochrome c family protein